MNTVEAKIKHGVGLDKSDLSDASQTQGARLDGVIKTDGAGIADYFTIQQAASFTKTVAQIREQSGLSNTDFSTMLGSSLASVDILQKQVGQIEDLGNSITAMFDKLSMANSEMTTDVVGKTTVLVENYEAVGRQIASLINTYGEYNAAVITLAATQQAQVASNLSAQVTSSSVVNPPIQNQDTTVSTALDATRSLLDILGVAVKDPYVQVGVMAAKLTIDIYELIDALNTETEAERKLREEQERKQTTTYGYLHSMAKEQAEVDILFGKLKTLTVGTKEYNDTKNEIISGYGQYLQGLGDEITSLRDVEGAYKAISTAAVDAARKRAIADATSNAADQYAGVEISNLRNIRGQLNGMFDKNKATEYFNHIKNNLRDNTPVPENVKGDIEAKLRGKYKGQVAYGAGYSTLGGTEVFDHYIGNQLNIIKAARTAMNNEIRDTTELLNGIYNESDDPDNSKKTKSKIKPNITINNRPKKDINADNVNAGIDSRTKKIEEYEDIIVAKTKKSEFDISQASINAMDDGIKKKIAQNKLNYDKLIFANQEREAQMVTDLQNKRELEWENNNPQAKEKGETFDRNSVTVADLSPAQKSQLQSYTNIANEVQKKGNDDLLKSLLVKYKTYEQQKTEINTQFDLDRDAIIKSDLSQDEKFSAIEALERRRGEAIKAVKAQEVEAMKNSSSLLVALFEGASNKSISEINKITDSSSKLLNYLSTTEVEDITPQFGFTVEQLKVLKESPKDVEAIGKAVKELNAVAVQNNTFASLGKDLKDIFKAGESDDSTEKKLMKLGKSASASADMIGNLAGKLSEMFKAAGNNEAAEAMTTVQEVMGTISNIGKGFAQGGLVGGIFAAVGEVAEWTAKAFAAQVQHEKALSKITADKTAQQRAYNLLLLEQNLLYEKGTTIFGVDTYGKAVNSIKVMKDALKELNFELSGGAKKQREALESFRRGNGIANDPSIKDRPSFDGNKDINNNVDRRARRGSGQVANIDKPDFSGLKDIEIKTGHKKTGLFGWGEGEDTYSSILKMYPKLISENGKFNTSLAETIMKTREMSEEDKAAFQQMIDSAKLAEEALKQVKDYLSGIFGELGNTMSDALVDAFVNGTDAGKAFYDSVSTMLENLAKQMIYSVTIGPLMEKAQEDMLSIMKDDTLSEKEKFEKYTETIKVLTGDVISQQNKANELYKFAQDTAAEQGFKMFNNNEQREAAKRGIATASQESVDENNGRLTMIQDHTFTMNNNISLMTPNVESIKQSMDVIRENAAGQLTALHAIRDNTSPIAQMKAEMSLMRNDIGTMVLRGVKIIY